MIRQVAIPRCEKVKYYIEMQTLLAHTASNRPKVSQPRMFTPTDTLPVDLQLAYTYIPAIKCICKATALILVVANTAALESVPALVAMAAVLLLDRVCRSETLFDSNSLLCTLLASYLVDSVRAQNEGGVILGSTALHKWATAAMWTSVILSTLLITDNHWIKCRLLAAGHQLPLTLQVAALYASTQTPAESNRSSHDQVMMRSFAFLCLCVTWTYTVGVKNMIDLLNTTSRLPTYVITNKKTDSRRGTHSVVVQAFTPCIVRFAPILFATGWSQASCILLHTVALCYRISTVSRQDVHPEYCTASKPCSTAGGPDASPLYLQQDLHHTSNLDMSIKRIPLDTGQYSDPTTNSGSTRAAAQSKPQPKPQQGQSTTTVTAMETEPKKQPTGSSDDHYAMFALARQQASEAARAAAQSIPAQVEGD